MRRDAESVQNKSSYDRHLVIDTMRLDEEWMKQPGLFMYWAEQAQKIKLEVDLAKFQLESLEAQVSNDIRANPEKFGLEKVTETGIKNAVLLDKRIAKSTKDYLKLRSEADVLAKLVAALEQRKKALENLVFLTTQGYFSAPEKRKRRGVKGISK